MTRSLAKTHRARALKIADPRILLHHLRDASASARLAAAIRSEAMERVELTGDLWPDLVGDTPSRFVDAVHARLFAPDAQPK